MTKDEALELLKTAPRGSSKSRINPSFTVDDVYKIVLGSVEEEKDGELGHLMTKRVWQIVKNQRRPRY